MCAVWRGVVVKWEHGPAFNTAITEDEAARLEELARGRRVLEIGSAYGYSAAVMALAGAVRVTAVDPHNAVPSKGIMAESLEALNVADRVDMWCEYSGTALPRLAELKRKFGLIFVDGDHSVEAAARDAAMALPLLEPGGVLACHDYRDPDCPGVGAALDKLFRDGPDRLTGTLWEKAI
jgi:predicted O-methyltransferase YrrM